MSLFTSLFLQCLGVILGIVIVFQIAGKIFLKEDFQPDEQE